MGIEQLEQEAITIENALVQFSDAIKSQEQLQRQTSRRTAQIIRYGASILILLFIVVVFLTWSLKQDMDKMTGYMEEMATGVSSMNHSIVQMQSSINTMGTGIRNVASHTQSISRSIVQPDNSVAILAHIADSVSLMQSDAQGLNKNIDSINHNLTNIQKQMRSLNRKLGAMGQDVNRMPSPGKMFPF